jgi:hypothetical protein
MQKRRRFKHSVSSQNRLALFAKDARNKAIRLPPCKERHQMLNKVRRADIASQMTEWAKNAGTTPTGVCRGSIRAANLCASVFVPTSSRAGLLHLVAWTMRWLQQSRAGAAIVTLDRGPSPLRLTYDNAVHGKTQ